MQDACASPSPSTSEADPAGDARIETYGWDAIVAFRLDLFNRLVTQKGFGITGFSFATRTGGAKDSELSCAAGPWQLEDVYGPQMTLATTLQSGTLRTPLGPVIDLAGARVEVTVVLALSIKPGDPAGVQGPSLVADPSGSRSRVAVTLPPPGDVGKAAVATIAWSAWLKDPASLDMLAQIFEPLSVTTGPGPLGPKAARVAGARDGDGRASVALLCKTLDDDIVGLQDLLWPAALARDEQAALIVSGTCFLAAIIRPALPGAFGTDPKTAAEDYLVSGGELTNLVPLSLTCSDGKGGTQRYRIDTRNLLLRMAEEGLVLRITDMTTALEISDPAIGLEVKTYIITVQYNETLTIARIQDPADPSRQMMTLVSERDPEVTHDVEATLATVITSLVIQVALVVVEVLVARFVPGAIVGRGFSLIAAKVIAGLAMASIDAAGMVVGQMDKIVDDIKSGDLSSIPDFATTFGPTLKAIDLTKDFSPGEVRCAETLVCTLNRTEGRTGHG